MGRILRSHQAVGTTDSPTFAGLYLGEYLWHTGDADTWLRLLDDEIVLEAGGVRFLDLVQAASNLMTFNPDSGDLDAQFKGQAVANLLRVDASADSVQFGGAAQWVGGCVWYVPIGASIAAYITAATAGDTLVLGSGTYTVTAALAVSKRLAIIGQGAGNTIINCATNSVHAVHITASNCYLGHLSVTLTSTAGTGDAVRVDGVTGAGTVLTGVVIENVDITITGTVATMNGIRVMDASAVIRNCRVTGTTGTGAGLWLDEDTTAEANTTVMVFGCFVDIAAYAGTSYGITVRDTGSAATLTVQALYSRFRMVRGAAVTTYGAHGYGDGTTLTLRHCMLEADATGGYDIAQQDPAGTVNATGCTSMNGTVSGTVGCIGTFRAYNITAYNEMRIVGPLNHDGATVGFYAVTPVVKGAALTVPLTTVTCSAPGTPDYAIADLVAGGYGFVAKDEGQSVLTVIANLQARVNQLEARLGSTTGVGLFT